MQMRTNASLKTKREGFTVVSVQQPVVKRGCKTSVLKVYSYEIEASSELSAELINTKITSVLNEKDYQRLHTLFSLEILFINHTPWFVQDALMSGVYMKFPDVYVNLIWIWMIKRHF